MTKSTQILDVAYGTFSCRLEGFDDSVETMKTVVSYFHDLAGHNRFMDVDPQAPDMETLALLTAEQAGTDIEIAGEGQNVSLRAADEETQDADIFAEDDIQEDDDVAEEIENIAAPEPDYADDETENVFEEDEDPIVLTDADDDDDDDDVAFDEADFGNTTDADDYVEDLEVSNEEAPMVAETEEIDTVEDEEESIAAKLQRIRAVVGRGHVQAPVAPVATDDAGDDEDDAPAVNPLAQRLADLAKRNAELAAADAEAEELSDESDHFAEDHDDLEVEDVAAEEDDGEMDDAEDVAHAPLVLTPAQDVEADEPDAFEDEDIADEVDTETFDLSAELNDVTREIEARDATRSKSADLPDSPDTAFSRILNQTDAHLNAPEGRRQRDAFAQLKAAVAATEAAREFGDDSPADAKDNAFREDLGAHDAEENDAPSPLQLVPSQTAAPVDAAANRLRQIASKVEENMAPTSGGFAEFAQEQGATELADLLEAAAAYIAFVEGDEDFSRPQVMKKVQSASDSEISREDGLRTFGRLLRQSKIVKLNNGRFQVAEDTRFRPSGT
jgi:hypothetical protein